MANQQKLDDATRGVLQGDYKDEKKLNIPDATADGIVLADIAWRVGKAICDKEAELAEHDIHLTYDDYVRGTTQLATQMAPGITEDDLDRILAMSPINVYKNPDYVLAFDPQGGDVLWMPKKGADNLKMPYVRSVGEAIKTLAANNDVDYADVAYDIGGDYGDDLMNYAPMKWAEDPSDIARQIGGKFMDGVTGIVAPRTIETMNDPQLRGKENAMLKAGVGDAVEVGATTLPFGVLKKTKKAYDATKPVRSFMGKALVGAKEGALGGAAGYGAGLVYDKNVPNTHRETREFDPVEAALATGSGAVLGGIAEGISPRSYGDAARHVLFERNPAGFTDKTAVYKEANKVPDNIVKAAKEHRFAYGGENPWVYESMNKPEFDVDFTAPEEFLPKRGRVARPDEPEAGKYFPLQDNPDGGTAASAGKSGIELVQTNAPEVAAQQKAKAAAQKTMDDVNSKLSKVEMTQLPKTKVATNDNQLTLLDAAIEKAKADGEDTTRLELMRAKLLDENAKRTAGGANADARITAGNNAKNSQIADLYNKKVAAQQTLNEPDLIPTSEHQLVKPDEELADQWATAVNKKYNIGMSNDNAKKFLVNSQGGRNRPEYQMTHGTMRIPRREINEARGRLKTGTEDQSYKNNMYQLYGELEPVGVDKKAWAKAKGESSKRQKMEPPSSADIVGGQDFDAKVKAERGSHPTLRSILTEWPAKAAIRGPAHAWEKEQKDKNFMQDYYIDFVPTKH